MIPNAGGGSCGISANEYSCAHGAQINFEDQTPYLTYDVDPGTHPSKYCIVKHWTDTATWKRRRYCTNSAAHYPSPPSPSIFAPFSSTFEVNGGRLQIAGKVECWREGGGGWGWSLHYLLNIWYEQSGLRQINIFVLVNSCTVLNSGSFMNKLSVMHIHKHCNVEFNTWRILKTEWAPSWGYIWLSCTVYSVHREYCMIYRGPGFLVVV
jgi:hypothetical protein